MKKINWKKASGEVIGFSIALLFLIGFFSQIIGTCVYVAHKEELNEAVMRIGRGIVTEDSMDKAQEKAEKAMKAYMEIIEAAVLFGIAVFLATGVMMLANKTDNGMNNVGDKIDKEFDTIINSNNDH